MYLKCFILLVLIKFVKLDCGCGSTNRESKCENEDALYKYTKESNTPSDSFNLSSEELDLSKMALIEGGTFIMGTNEPYFEADFEGPARNVTLKPFYIDKYEVSNKDFSEFIKKTGYKTEAEVFGDSFIFELLIKEEERPKYENFRAVAAPWWVKMKGVTWDHPKGEKSNIEDRMNHPVIHVSWNDAVKFCNYWNKRLPTEAEWEMACRGGLKQKLYPWGNKLMPKDQHWANIWQGEFPQTNTAEDGFIYTCPVDQFPPNIFGLHNMAGNVWEWTQDSWKENSDEKVKKGGSYMCHKSYCWRYRCAARSQNTKDSTASNLGFRCAKDA